MNLEEQFRIDLVISYLSISSVITLLNKSTNYSWCTKETPKVLLIPNCGGVKGIVKIHVCVVYCPINYTQKL